MLKKGVHDLQAFLPGGVDLVLLEDLQDMTEVEVVVTAQEGLEVLQTELKIKHFMHHFDLFCGIFALGGKKVWVLSLI